MPAASSLYNTANSNTMQASSQQISSSLLSRSAHAPFPEAGSVIGPDGRYFCLGKLGKGTFCSIHKCVDLSYSHTIGQDLHLRQQQNGEGPESGRRRQRIVAAKAELANFVDSGVIDGEAAVLKFLDFSLPPGMVPTYVDYVRQPATSTESASLLATGGSAANLLGMGEASNVEKASNVANGGISAIIMEYLPGEDMHLLRDRHCQSIAATAKAIGGGTSAGGSSSSSIPRRVSVEDAVYLVADVMLPLLKAMHEVGMVHRDVKPSNVVRTGTTASDRKFKIVDFGLSKSFVVPKDSTFADPQRPWKGRWMSPSFSSSISNTTKNANSTNNLNSTVNELSSTVASIDEEPKDMLRGGCIRLERECAEFRGTSMYASLRVHQGKDHCPRDDIWGLLYVFCDLVSGGLPWMSHAAARDRDRCQILKEIVLGERGRDDWTGADRVRTADPKHVIGVGDPNPDLVPKNGEDAMEWLLFGSEYHMAKYKRDLMIRFQGEKAEYLPSVPEPSEMAKNEHYVQCLRRAFRHVASLGFVEMPDYKLIEECIRGFCKDPPIANDQHHVPPIDWKDHRSNKRRRTLNSQPSRTINESRDVVWNPIDEDAVDPLDENTLNEADFDRWAALEAAAAALDEEARGAGGAPASSAGISSANNPSGVSSSLDPGVSLSGEAADLARLPLQMQFHLSQVEYNALHHDTIPMHLALRDWMALAIPLAHEKWDAANWERGNHRTQDDGYRNEVYMSMLQKCLDAAEPFNGFADMRCYYYPSTQELGQNNAIGESALKRRKVNTSFPRDVSEVPSTAAECEVLTESPLVIVSRVFFLLRLALDLERGKNFAPPPKLSFGFGRPGMTVGALT
mmetsp:Transcript_17487/g.33374  ORF Transcript_17487/g.33374 Transcript_17487/m.33374 type:complete len:852 (-) Transcript_17487:68-2623(-)